MLRGSFLEAAMPLHSFQAFNTPSFHLLSTQTSLLPLFPFYVFSYCFFASLVLSFLP